MVQLILSLVILHILFRINQTSIIGMYNAHFYDLLETGKNWYSLSMNRSEMNWRIVLFSTFCRTIVRKYNGRESS